MLQHCENLRVSNQDSELQTPTGATCRPTSTCHEHYQSTESDDKINRRQLRVLELQCFRKICLQLINSIYTYIFFYVNLFSKDIKKTLERAARGDVCDDLSFIERTAGRWAIVL